MDAKNIVGKWLVAMALGSSAFLTGCTINQQIKPLEQRPQQVCIVNNTAVKEGVLDALNEGFENHGLTPRVIPGVYTKQFNVWHPSWQIQQTEGCDAMVLYVANWTWDLALYMYYANIWMTSPDGTLELARAMYDSSHGSVSPAKFINGHDKIIELVNAMLSGMPSR
jgi:hypothetical protein